MNSKKRCKFCKLYFPAGDMVKVPAGTFCTIEHAMEFAKQPKEREKAAQKRHKEKLKQVRRNPRAEALLVAQKLARISRADDDGYVKCVTCDWVGKWNEYCDGGHYIAKGSSSYWMLDPRNIWPQCKSCNGNGMKFDGRESKYTLFMIDQFGREFVDHMQETKKRVVKRTAQDYDKFIEKAKADIKEHEKRISGS